MEISYYLRRRISKALMALTGVLAITSLIHVEKAKAQAGSCCTSLNVTCVIGTVVVPNSYHCGN